MTHYLIYKITNNVNGKIYIGKHKTENLDDGYMGSGKLLLLAYKKYGKENFTKEILYDVDDEELMDFVEEIIVDTAFIARDDTYNLKIGGVGGAGPRTEETKRKISEANKGKHLSEEAKRKVAEAHKGHTAWNKGKTGVYSEETRRRMSESLKGRPGHPHSEETKKKMSKSRMGHPGYMKGKHHSEETRRKMSEAIKRALYQRQLLQKIRIRTI